MATGIKRMYADFTGVDFLDEPSLVDIKRSPDALNVWKNYRDNQGTCIETRPGYRKIAQISNSKINGIYIFGLTKAIIHSGTMLYEWSNFPSVPDNEHLKILYSDMNNIRSNFNKLNNKLYINDGKNYLTYNGDTVKKIENDNPYIPRTSISRKAGGKGGGELLEDVAKLNIPRITFMTSHPWDFTDKMIDVIASHENILPYIHLPLQSGSNKILKLMGRRYTKESYLELFDKMKKKIPNVSISTDIIVGFPGEDEKDFEETLEVVNYCKYDNAFTFIYSPRENTPAAKLKDNVTLEEKEKRLYKLNDTVNKYFLENNKKMIGKIEEVLVEGISEKKKDNYYGYTRNHKLINFTGDNIKAGDIVNVEVTDAKTWSLDGKLSK